MRRPMRPTKQTRPTNTKPKRRVFEHKPLKLRPCVLPLTFIIPLIILGVERYLGVLFDFSLDNIQKVYYEQIGWNQSQEEEQFIPRVSEVPTITNLTTAFSKRTNCPPNLVRMVTIIYPSSYSLKTAARKITDVIHQTSKSRCLTRNFAGATSKWTFRKSSYYHHDDKAVDRLLHHHFPEFPLLRTVVNDCLNSRKMKTLLWKYLALWSFGGIFIDLNLLPSTNFSADTIKPTDDGFFLLEGKNNWLSTKFMAVSPRHPLMYYAVQHSLKYLLRADNLDFFGLSEDSLDIVLQEAFAEFRKECGKEADCTSSKGVKQGVYRGSRGRSIRVGGNLDGDDLLSRVFHSEEGVQLELSKMDMVETHGKESRKNCFRAILDGTSSETNVFYT